MTKRSPPKPCPRCGELIPNNGRATLTYCSQLCLCMDRIAINPDSGCWEWTGSLNVHGYGRFSWGSKLDIRAHRTMYEAMVGPIPIGMVMCHHCDNPRCVNPDHLFAGTMADNMRDMDQKGRRRNAPQRGSQNPRSKLLEADVITIRNRLSEGERGADLAAEYGVTRALISRIKMRKCWAHI